MPAFLPGLDEAGERARLRALRRRLADELERMVDLLDLLDGDPDLEEAGDDEPTLGAPERDRITDWSPRGRKRCTSQEHWTGGPLDQGLFADEAEEEDEHGTDLDCGEYDEAEREGDELDRGEHDDADDEPSLGSLGGTAATCDSHRAEAWSAGSLAFHHYDAEAEHDGREPDDSGIGDEGGRAEQLGMRPRFYGLAPAIMIEEMPR